MRTAARPDYEMLRPRGLSWKATLAAALTCLLFAPGASGAEPTALAILPIYAGQAVDAKVVAAQLQQRLLTANLSSLGPDTLSRRVRQHSEVIHGLQIAARELKQAADATLYLRRQQAVESARAALAALDGIGAQLYERKMMARARAELGLALLLRPEDDAGAIEAFRLAHTLDPGLTVDPDRLPPRARVLLRRAAAERVPFKPSVTALKRVVELSGMRRLVWLAVRDDGDQLWLDVMVYDARRGIQSRLEPVRVASRGEIAEAAARVVTQAVQPLVAGEQRPEPQTPWVGSTDQPWPVTDRPLSRPPSDVSRHRRRIWTWVTAATAGAALAAGVVLRLSAEADADEFHALAPTERDRGEKLADRYEVKAWTANGLFALAGALGIAATILYFVEGRHTDRGSHRANASHTPSVKLSPAGIALTFAR